MPAAPLSKRSYPAARISPVHLDPAEMIKVADNRSENLPYLQAAPICEIDVSGPQPATRDHEVAACSPLNSLLVTF